MTGGGIFVLVMVGIFFFLLMFVLLLGWFYPGSGARQLDWRPTRSPELEAQNEIDDVAQMLEAANERRRRRGEAELTEAAITARVQEDQRKRIEQRDRYLADAETEQLLAARNERRRARGLPEQTLEEFRGSLGAERR